MHSNAKSLLKTIAICYNMSIIDSVGSDKKVNPVKRSKRVKPDSHTPNKI